LAFDAVQPVGRVVRPSKSVQMSASPAQPLEPELDEELLELEDELLELEELLEDDELLELEELLDELELLEDELLELDEELLELDPDPPQAARAQDARMTGINLRMLVLPQLLLWMQRMALVGQAAVASSGGVGLAEPVAILATICHSKRPATVTSLANSMFARSGTDRRSMKKRHAAIRKIGERRAV